MNWTSVNFNWNHTRAFLVTAEEGTLSAAAKALGVTQPTLSRQVASLETELGIALFERVGQRLVLTKSGTELLERARSMGDIALKLALTATGKSQQIEGSVVVSVGELDAVFRLPKIIAPLRREEPGIEIEVVVTNETSDLKRRPYPLSTMIRIHSMQHRYNMSVPAMEDVLYEITSMCLFAHLSLDNPIPDHTTIMNFRHLLEKDKLSCQLIKEVNRWLSDASIYFKEGTIVDATIIETASSTKNNAIARAPELH